MVSRNLIKLVHSLEQKKNRRNEGLFVAEGPKVVADLMHSHRPVWLIATREWLATVRPDSDVVIEATDDELRRASFLQHPQQVIGLFPLPAETEFDATLPSEELCLALDGVQDPGNVGTILRIADWFGIRNVYCSRDTADAFSPKVVQASMGSIARVSVSYVDLPQFLDSIPMGTPLYGTLLDGDNIYREQLSRNGVIVMGNEGRGLSDAVRSRVNRRLLIPSFSKKSGADSLNVAIATAVVCSEFRRRFLS